MANLPQVNISTDLSDGMCFGCGRNNPIGLKLKFQPDSEKVRTEFTPGEQYQGWPGVVHGGIVISMLDEAMTYAAHFKGVACLTARMSVSLKRMAKVGEKLVVTSRVTKKSRKLVETQANIALADGTPVAESSALHYVVGDSENGNAA